jgi:hypothetical protein
VPSLGYSREDGPVKIDNVICRTPARNMAALEMVKNEILQMSETNVSRVS